jgi:hypothetical protein
MINTSLFGPLSQKNRDTFSSVKEQAFDFMLKRLFIQNFCKRSRCLEENPVFLFLSPKKLKKYKNVFSCLFTMILTAHRKHYSKILNYPLFSVWEYQVYLYVLFLMVTRSCKTVNFSYV